MGHWNSKRHLPCDIWIRRAACLCPQMISIILELPHWILFLTTEKSKLLIWLWNGNPRWGNTLTCCERGWISSLFYCLMLLRERGTHYSLWVVLLKLLWNKSQFAFLFWWITEIKRKQWKHFKTSTVCFPPPAVDLWWDIIIAIGIIDVLHSCTIVEVSLYTLYTRSYLILYSKGYKKKSVLLTSF